MYRIIKIGMDVHSTSFSLCAVEPRIGEEDRILGTCQTAPDYKEVIRFIKNLKMKLGIDDEYDIVCGYEAGCLGYSLHNQLTHAGVKCVILAPSTMMTSKGKRIKTDARDAHLIALCLANGTYKSVYIPTEKDNSVKEYIRMRDDHKEALKKVKQQINALCLRHGYRYEKTTWTNKHFCWLHTLSLPALCRETLDEYIATCREHMARIDRFDNRIEEISQQEGYQKKVRNLTCFLGVKTHTALSLIVETGDFNRFKKGNIYAAYLGLIPGEDSSGDHIKRLSISKAGNVHLRCMLVEASKGICKGTVGYKSKALKARQEGNSGEVIAYADKANLRLRRRYYHLIRKGKKKNVAVTAVARELACYVWGMMTENITMETVQPESLKSASLPSVCQG